MTFKDVFKSSFLENVVEISAVDVLIAMAFACVLGAFIYFIYKRTFQGVMYSSGFGITLVGLTTVTTPDGASRRQCPQERITAAQRTETGVSCGS